MKDGELLELAAKAYGIDWENVLQDGGSFVDNGRVWNPLENNDDAFALSAHLKIDVQHDEEDVLAWYWLGYGNSDAGCVTEPVGDDRVAAARCAITRAAAERGKYL